MAGERDAKEAVGEPDGGSAGNSMGEMIRVNTGDGDVPRQALMSVLCSGGMDWPERRFPKGLCAWARLTGECRGEDVALGGPVRQSKGYQVMVFMS